MDGGSVGWGVTYILPITQSGDQSTKTVNFTMTNKVTRYASTVVGREVGGRGNKVKDSVREPNSWKQPEAMRKTLFERELPLLLSGRQLRELCVS